MNGDVLTAAEAARLLGLSDSAVVKRIKKGTLTAEKIGHEWAIPEAEIERILSSGGHPRRRMRAVPSGPDLTDQTEPHPTSPTKPDLADQTEPHPTSPTEPDLTDQTEPHPTGPTEPDLTKQTGPNPTPGSGDPSAKVLAKAEDIALAQENEVLRLKLEHSEREHATTSDALEDMRSEVGHLRSMNTQQADTIQNLAEEMKGLTIALHHEQNQRLALEAHVTDESEEEDEEKEKKRGFVRRVFTRKPKRKRGKFARVGPS